MGKNAKITNEEFIRRSQALYGDNSLRYDKLVCNGNKQEVTLYCQKKDETGNDHGYFQVVMQNHLNQHQYGCPKCKAKRIGDLYRKPLKQWIEESQAVHGDRYDYTLVEYKNQYNKVLIKCNKCGTTFRQTPKAHSYYDQGCPVCRESHLENEIRIFFQTENIVFQTFYKPDWLGRQSLDFYLPRYKVAIECQGKQHFKKECQFGRHDEHFEIIVKRDERKRRLCEENGIRLLYYSNLGIEYPYHVFEDKEELLNEILKQDIVSNGKENS